MKVGSTNTVVSNLWNLYLSVGTMKNFKTIVIMCKFGIFKYLVHFCKNKIISLGM